MSRLASLFSSPAADAAVLCVQPPGLGIVLVGTHAPSEIYVRNKVRAGTESGLRVDLNRLPASATLDELLALVRQLRPPAVDCNWPGTP